MKQKTTDVTLKEYAVNYMRTQTNSFEYTIKVIKSFEELAHAEFKKLSTGPDAIDTTSLEMILSAMLNIQ